VEKSKQQLIIVFACEDISAIERIVDTYAVAGPRYNSPKGQMPAIFSAKAPTTKIFDALRLSKADFIMTTIGMESENVFSMGEISQSLFFTAHGKKQNAMVDYWTELKKALNREDYEEAAVLRDIIANGKTRK
jgi:hypothetical protein